MFLEEYLNLIVPPRFVSSTCLFVATHSPSIKPISTFSPTAPSPSTEHTSLSVPMMATPDVDSSLDTLPKLLQLPLELRQEIYSYLCPADPISNPIPSVGITCVSHRPPPLSLLLTCRAIYDDVLSYYHSIATWKLIASHAFNFYRIDPTLSNFASSRLLKRLQRVELVFYFDGGLLKSYPSFKQRNYCEEIKKRATKACEILASAPELEVVQVSWVDTITDSGLEEKRSVLEALQSLDGKVRLETGCLQWSNAQASPQREEFEDHLSSLIQAPRLPVVATF